MTLESTQEAGSSEHGPVGAHPHTEQRLHEHRRSLAKLMRSGALSSGDIASALREVTELACGLLAAERTSVWQLSADGCSLSCVDSYSCASAQHDRGEQLSSAEQPGYFAALHEERVLSVSHARSDPRTREAYAGRLAPAGIEALLAAPICLRGRLVGVVCIEHQGPPRHWQLWEELAAGTLSDFVARVLQTREQLRLERQLRELGTSVEDILERRTSQVVRENADLQREVDALQFVAGAIKRSEHDLRGLFAASPVPMMLVRNQDRRIVLANEKCASALRCEPAALKALPVAELFTGASEVAELFARLEHSGSEEAREVRLKAVGGEVFWALVSACEVVFSGEAMVMIGFTDLTAQKAVEHQLRFLAQRDPLTQAYNRHRFWQLANAEMGRVRRYGRPLSLAMIDADHFKSINDRLGHDVGDLVLRTLVDTCHDNLRKHDVLARFGGEELVVMLPETRAAGAQAVMERVRQRIEATPLVLDDGVCVSITVSIGVAELRDPQEALEALLKRADEALYAAKENGRNRVEMG